LLFLTPGFELYHFFLFLENLANYKLPLRSAVHYIPPKFRKFGKFKKWNLSLNQSKDRSHLFL